MASERDLPIVTGWLQLRRKGCSDVACRCVWSGRVSRMTDMRDMTWRFINLAPTVASQTALDSLFAETLKPFGVERFDCSRIVPGGESETAGVLADRGLTGWVNHFLE